MATNKLQVKDFTRLFLSPELWQVPIESFIEAYCLIFTPNDNNDSSNAQAMELQTSRQGDIEERLKIFNSYKQLINEILTETILRGRPIGRDKLYKALSKFVAMDNSELISNERVMEALKYMLAVEDFHVFTVFMEDMNIILNDQSASHVSEYLELKRIQEEEAELERQKAEEKRAKELEKKRQKLQKTPRETQEAIDLAIQVSLAEEEERKRKEREREEDEEEAFRMAMEMSLKTAISEKLKAIAQSNSEEQVLAQSQKLYKEQIELQRQAEFELKEQQKLHMVESQQPIKVAEYSSQSLKTTADESRIDISIIKDASIMKESPAQIEEEEKVQPLSRQISNFRITSGRGGKVAKKLPLIRIQQQQISEAFQQSNRQKQSVEDQQPHGETLEERRLRLRAHRDALYSMKPKQPETPETQVKQLYQ